MSYLIGIIFVLVVVLVPYTWGLISAWRAGKEMGKAISQEVEDRVVAFLSEMLAESRRRENDENETENN